MPHKQAEHIDLAKNRASLTRFAWLSIAAAVVTITLKSGAYLLTDSVGLLSDALESLVNLAGAVMALLMLSIAVTAETPLVTRRRARIQKRRALFNPGMSFEARFAHTSG